MSNTHTTTRINTIMKMNKKNKTTAIITIKYQLLLEDNNNLLKQQLLNRTASKRSNK